MSRDLEQILEEGEQYDLEIKAAQGKDGKGSLPKSVWESYSAMANTDGGMILLGLEENKDQTYTALGIQNIQKVKKEIFDMVNDPKKVSENLLSSQSVRTEVIDEKECIVIEVPRATRKQRPVFINGNPLTGTYIRNHEGDFKCNKERVKRMLADSNYDARDFLILKNSKLTDLNESSLEAYRILFRTTKPDHPWIDLPDEEFLRNIAAWKVDRETGEQGLTIAGLLMFGNFTSIRDFFPNFIIDYREETSEDPDERWVDRVTLDGSWSGNFYEFVRKVLPKLVADLKIPFKIESNNQRVDETHVHEAIREALINSIVHCDLSGDISIVIKRVKTGFIFKNSGSLRLPLDRIFNGGESDCRNKTLQKMFQHIGFAEQAGSGIPKILRAWKEQHWRVPLIKEDREQDSTMLGLPTLSLIPEKSTEELKEVFGAEFDSLDREDRIILIAGLHEKDVTHLRLQQLVDMHPHDLSAKLKKLCYERFLSSKGTGRGKVYGLNRGFLHDGPNSEHLTPQSSEHLGSSSEHLNLQTWAQKLGQKVSTTKKVDRKTMENVLLEILALDWFSIKDLADLTKRSPDTLRTHYLNPFIKAGKIEIQFPEAQNHPNQKYRKK